MRNRSRKTAKRCFWNLLKTKKKPASHQAKLKKKVFGTRRRKSRTPAGFVRKPLRNRSRKNAETRKMPKRCFWNLLKTKKNGCLKQGKPLRNVRLGSLQATRPNSRKRCLGRACEKAEPQQVLCPSHCETAAGKMPKRRFWNPLKRKKCPNHAKPQPENCRNVAFGTYEKCRNVAFGTY